MGIFLSRKLLGRKSESERLAKDRIPEINGGPIFAGALRNLADDLILRTGFSMFKFDLPIARYEIWNDLMSA